jgi:exonuclease III
VRTLAGRTFLYSGRPNKESPHLEEVRILLSKRDKCSLIDRKPVSERLMSARFKARARNVRIVQLYAPTEKADGQTKERFYVDLQNTIKSVDKKDMLIVMGDLNAKVSSSNVGL